MPCSVVVSRSVVVSKVEHNLSSVVGVRREEYLRVLNSIMSEETDTSATGVGMRQEDIARFGAQAKTDSYVADIGSCVLDVQVFAGTAFNLELALTIATGLFTCCAEWNDAKRDCGGDVTPCALPVRTVLPAGRASIRRALVRRNNPHFPHFLASKLLGLVLLW